MLPRFTAVCLFVILFGQASAHSQKEGSISIVSESASFESHKPDIINPYLDDIQYDLIKTNSSFLAIGGIIKGQHAPKEELVEIVSPPEEAGNAKAKRKKRRERRNTKRAVASGPEISTNPTAEPNSDSSSLCQTLDGLLEERVYSANLSDDSSQSGDSVEQYKGISDLLDDIEEVNNANSSGRDMRQIHSGNMLLKEVDFTSLKDWNHDNFANAMLAFLNSCRTIQAYRPTRVIQNSELVFGRLKDWLDVCTAAADYQNLGKHREFFEEHFRPFLVLDKDKNTGAGSFTGYHELSIIGSLSPSEEYRYPLYRKPRGCSGSQNCPTRREINDGALDGLNLELCWVSSPFDLWKMQIQGSGIIVLPDSTFLRISFGGTNSHKTKNVWDYIYKNLPTQRFKHNSIRELLSQRSSLAMSIINYDPSYTFFDQNNKSFAVGGHRSGLVPGRSIAIDIRYIPYGMPMWVQTNLPIRDRSSNRSWVEFNRMMVAQDAGAAVKGPVRADIFFGHGDKATYLANHTKFSGSYYMLIPVKVIPNIQKRTPTS